MLNNYQSKITRNAMLISIVMFAILNLNQLAKADQPDTGTKYAICVAVMYFAIGESNASEKDFYRSISQNFILKASQIMDDKKFGDTYDNAKKVINGYSDSEFRNIKNSCVAMANQ
jgi:hypothetical protein